MRAPSTTSLVVKVAATLTLILVVFVSIGVDRAAARQGACKPPSGSVIKRSGAAVLYESVSRSSGTRIFMCSRKFRGRTLISNHPLDSFNEFVTRGDFAAFIRTDYVAWTYGVTIQVEVANLRTHRSSRRATRKEITPTELCTCDCGSLSAFCEFEGFQQVVLSNRGSIAFVKTITSDQAPCPVEITECPGSHQYHTIHRMEFNSRLNRGNMTALGHLKREEIPSLRVTGSQLRWTGQGAAKSAPIH